MYSNRVIIMDEIHHIKSSINKDDKSSRELTEILKDIMYACVNVRLILLSATPMFDDPNEIQLLMDLLMKNDKLIGRENYESKESIFKKEKKSTKSNSIDDFEQEDEAYELTSNFKKKLEYFSKNYVSFMRGENPYTFPLRLAPSVNNDSNVYKISDYPKLNAYGKIIKEQNQIKFTELIRSDASSFQKLQMKKLRYVKKNDMNTDNDNDNKNNMKRIQLSNICFPSSDHDGPLIGSNGITNLFEDLSDNDRLKLKYKKNDPFLDYDNLGKYSPKMKTIIDYVNNSDGIILIYTQYVNSGVIPLGIALEHIGYTKFGNNNILQNNKQIKKQSVKKNYITITGDNRLS